MNPNPASAPPPVLRIVDIDAVLPHEPNDAQRSKPLTKRLRKAKTFTNPPVVGAIDGGKYVLMDGANRHTAMKQLGFEHILVQVADYTTPFVALDVWQHVLVGWDKTRLIDALRQLPQISVESRVSEDGLAKALLRGGPLYSLRPAAAESGRNAALRKVTEAYHRHTTLYRTPLRDPSQIWALYPDAVAILFFAPFEPDDIVDAALQRDWLPPGVSRHIIHGRALKLNYPMSELRGAESLEVKNRALDAWMRAKLEARSLRYYAESIWNFDE